MDQLLGLAAQNPVVLVIEDAHWIDPTTSELLDARLVTARAKQRASRYRSLKISAARGAERPPSGAAVCAFSVIGLCCSAKTTELSLQPCDVPVATGAHTAGAPSKINGYDQHLLASYLAGFDAALRLRLALQYDPYGKKLTMAEPA